MGESTKSPSSASKYYGILEIPKSASLKDICKAYKHLVKKWHPDRNKSNQAEAVDKFRSINEAYRVLSKKKREEADLFKSDTAKTPKKSSKDEEDELQISSPTLLSRTTSRISPTVDFYTSMPACFTMSGTNTPTTPVSDQPPNNLSKVASKPIIFSQSTSRRKTQPIEKKLECTLEELCNGCVKKVIITRDVVATTGLIVKEEEVVTIMVKPGWKRGTKITFEGKGDERTGDIIFSIDEKTHPLYKREGDDLLLGVEVPLVQALTGCTITIPLLGRDEAMTMSFDDEIIYPGFEKVIPGQGMPKSKQESTNRGVSSGKSPEQRALLVESRRQEVLLLDNEIAFNEAIIEEREQGIQEIQQQIGEVNEIFKDLAVLVHEQGAMIDDIGSNVENAHAATAQGRSQLAKAAKTQRSNSSLTCLLLVIFGIVLLIVIVVLAA